MVPANVDPDASDESEASALRKIATYALFSRVGVGGGAGGCMATGTPPSAVRFTAWFAANVGSPTWDAALTPGFSLTHQPMYGELGWSRCRKRCRMGPSVAFIGSSHTTAAPVATAKSRSGPAMLGSAPTMSRSVALPAYCVHSYE